VAPQGRPSGAPVLTTASLVCLDRPERDQPNPDVDRDGRHPPRSEGQEQQWGPSNADRRAACSPTADSSLPPW
jgi:hypothetical protein